MRALIFIQTNDGKIYYKCDTFWSKSEKITNAKIYRDNQTEVDNWITPYVYNMHEHLKRNPEKLNDIIQLYDNCKMGYRVVKDELLSDDKFSIREDVNESELGELIYTHQVHINGLNEPKIFDIRKKIIREEKLNEILK